MAISKESEIKIKEVTKPVNRLFELELNETELMGLVKGDRFYRDMLYTFMKETSSVRAKEKAD